MVHSVRWRLVFNFMLVGLAAALTVGLVTLLIADSYFRQQEIDFLTRNADEIAREVEPVLERGATESQLSFDFWPGVHFVSSGELQLQSVVQFYSFMGQERVAVLDSQGQVLADSGEAPPFRIVELAASPSFSPNQLTIITTSGLDVPGFPSSHLFQIQPAQFGCGFQLNTLSSLSNESTAESADELSDLVVKVPIRSDTGEAIGHIQLSEGPAYGRPILQGIRLALAGGLGAAVLLAVVAGVLSAQQLIRPLGALGKAAEQMAAGDLSARAPNHRQDEFGRLAQQFNRMADQLQQTVERLAADREALRRFIADASHELRTPITALKTFNAIWDKSGKEERPDPQMLQANAAQIERLDALTQNLLDLSRLDSELSGVEFVHDDICVLLQRAESVFRPLMLENKIDLTLDIPDEPVSIAHDPVYLRRAVDNLLSNAFKFSPPGGRVSFGLTLTADTVAIWVKDSGPGIPADELPFIFDRFYRGIGATRTEGSGLGLAIVKAVAQTHHGRVEVDCSDGTRFTLCLPR